MRLRLRAAAFAAAGFGLFAVAGITAPSFATEADVQPAVSYADHAVSTLTADDLGLNELSDADKVPFSGPPAAVQAMTPAFSDAVEPQEPAERRTLSEMVDDLGGADVGDAETDCLARAIYFEAKSETLTGQLTVAEVIMNRAKSGRFPSTICGVVRQAGQFSFVRRGVIPAPPASSRDWREAVGVAKVAMQDLADGAAPRALFFHARHASPGWRLTRVATVGNHIFYR